MIGDAGEHVGEMVLRVEAIELGALQHSIENGGALPAGFGAEEQEVVAGTRTGRLWGLRGR